MKILFLQDDFPPQSFGGAGISTYDLAIMMCEFGHKIYVVTICDKREDEGRSEYDGISVFRIFSKYPSRWRAYVSLNNRSVVKKVENILKNIKPDIIHANNIHTHISYRCLKVARMYCGGVVLTAHDVMLFNYGKLFTKRYLDNLDAHTNWLDHIRQAKKRWNPLRNFFIMRYLKYTNKILAVSFALKKALGENGIKNVDVIHAGINLRKWVTENMEIDKFKNKYNITKKKVIMFGGRISEAKGGDKLIEALKYIVSEVPETILLIVGREDEYTKKILTKTERMGISKNIHITGWINPKEIRIAYSSSDIVLLPSIIFEAFGRVAIEAMISKKPVVGTCYGGVPEVIEDNVTGYVVNPLYPEQIAEKVIDLLKNPEKAKKFGEAGYERVKKEFNLVDKVNQHIKLYESFLSR